MSKALCCSKKKSHNLAQKTFKGQANDSHNASCPGFRMLMGVQFRETPYCPGSKTILYLSSPQNLEPVKPNQSPPIPLSPILSTFFTPTFLAITSRRAFSGHFRLIPPVSQPDPLPLPHTHPVIPNSLTQKAKHDPTSAWSWPYIS